MYKLPVRPKVLNLILQASFKCDTKFKRFQKESLTSFTVVELARVLHVTVTPQARRPVWCFGDGAPDTELDWTSVAAGHCVQVSGVWTVKSWISALFILNASPRLSVHTL